MNRYKDFEFAIAEWKTKKLPALIKRSVKIPRESSSIVCIAGGRQVGKTYRMFQLVKELRNIPKENILYVNFEHERLRNLDANDLEDLLKAFYKLSKVNEKYEIYLLLDEIQNVRDWDKWVRRVFDTGKFRIYITGSSSKILSSEIPKSLRGRNIDFLIFPFSFEEYLRAKKFKIKEHELILEKRGKLLKLLEEFLIFGSYPKISLLSNEEEKIKTLFSYYRAIFYRDLVENYKIKNTVALDLFLKYCLNSLSKYVSISKAYNYLKSLGVKCSKHTLIEFLEFSREIFFLFPLEIFSFSIKTKKQYPKKVYAIDNGIITALFPEYKEAFGRLMENRVAIELIKNSFEAPNFELYYWKDSLQHEVDFVLKEGTRVKELIQVTYASSLDEIEKRELRSLVKASELLKCKNLKVITWDLEEKIEFKGKSIKFVPLWKWLLKTK